MDGLRCFLCCALYENHSILHRLCATDGGVPSDTFTLGPRFDQYGNRVNGDGTLWNLDGKLAARNGND